MCTFIAWYIIFTGVFYNRIDELRGLSSTLWPFYVLGVMMGVFKSLFILENEGDS